MNRKSGKSRTSRFFGVTSRSRWVVVADRTEAVVYQAGKLGRGYFFLKRFTNEEGAMRESQLDSDRPGRGVSSAAMGTIRHGLDRRFHRHERVALTFARGVARALMDDHRAGRFGDFVLVGEPHFLGLLRHSLGLATRKAISFEIRRDYLHGAEPILRTRVLRAGGHTAEVTSA